MAAAPGTLSGSVGHSHGVLEGSHGILHVGGEKTCDKLTINESLLGRKLRGIDGGYDQFVAVVDAWELEWEQCYHSDVALEHETVNNNLQHVKIHQVATGKQHRLASSLDGQIFSWGTRNSAVQNGELGQVGGCNGPCLRKSSSKQSQRLCISPETGEDEVDEQERQAMRHSHTICQPRSVHTSKELFFRKIACGRNHGAAITDKGDLYTWGRNFEGQLGHFSRTLSKETSSLLNGIFVLLENGAIYTFGERFTGITRHPETKRGANPHLLIECSSDGAGFVGIACGFAHALAVSSSGELYSWGSNTYGQLGLGISDSIEGATAVPTRVGIPCKEWSTVFAGGNYSAAVTSNGELFTWGNGKHGQLAHASLRIFAWIFQVVKEERKRYWPLRRRRCKFRVFQQITRPSPARFHHFISGTPNRSVPAKLTAVPAVDWWKQMMSPTGFLTGLNVSMNGGKSSLPSKNARKVEVFALPAVGTLRTVFPPVGMLCGGTKVSISGSFFHFDTPDAVVSLQWRDKVVQVSAICSRLGADSDESVQEGTSSERRVIFETPPLPFPNDRNSVAAIAEGLVLGSNEEVEVFVALDGSHFADKSVRFAYCPVPLVLDISPMEAEPGTKMALKVERLVVSPHACVAPVDVNEATSCVEFILPSLPIASEDQVCVAFSVNGQQFVDKDPPATEDTTKPTPDGASGADSGGLTFKYKAPPASETPAKDE
ncbi:E3 ubiquitin protein ligase, partial [Globisporangium splendens]